MSILENESKHVIEVEPVEDKPLIKGDAMAFEAFDSDHDVVFNKDIAPIPEDIKTRLNAVSDVQDTELERVKGKLASGYPITDEMLDQSAEEMIEEGFVFS